MRTGAAEGNPRQVHDAGPYRVESLNATSVALALTGKSRTTGHAPLAGCTRPFTVPADESAGVGHNLWR